MDLVTEFNDKIYLRNKAFEMYNKLSDFNSKFGEELPWETLEPFIKAMEKMSGLAWKTDEDVRNIRNTINDLLKNSKQ